MEKKGRKPTLIKLSKEDREYLAYRRNLLTLEYLTKRLGKLDGQHPRFHIGRPKADLQEYVRSLNKERAGLHKRMLEYQERDRRKRANARPMVIGIGQDKAKVIHYLIESNQIQGASSTTSPIILGQSGECQIIHHIVDTPGSLLVFQDTGLRDPSSSVSFDCREVFYDQENALTCDASLFADDNFWILIDYKEYCLAYVIHRYDIPAPACDSLVNWRCNFRVGLHNPVLTAYYGWVRVCPVIAQSPTGSIPSFSEFMEEHVHYEYGVGRGIDDGEEYSWSNMPGPAEPFYVEHKGSYSVKAGVTSRVFFGITVDLWAHDGQIKGDGYGYVTYPPGATLSDPSNPPPFWPPRPGIQYLMWPESMMPECYISTAICSVLGKPDNCYELELLRHFRDTYVRSLANGKELIEDYYAKAPYLLALIDTNPDRDQILRQLYDRYLVQCIHAIEQGNRDRALSTYKEMLSYLESRVVPKVEIERERNLLSIPE